MRNKGRMRMKKISMWIAALLFAAVLAGCAGKQQADSGYRIYCVDESGTSLEAEEYVPQAEGGDALIRELAAKLGEAPKQIGHHKAIPDGIGILSAVQTERSLRVDFNGTYSEMDNITEVFCRAAVVKTLAQVPGVDTVEFTVNGKELTDSQGNPIGVMSSESFIDTKGNGINSYAYAALTLYFADESGKKLEKEVRSLHYSSNESLEQVVVEEMIQGPENGMLQAVVPEDMKIMDVVTEKKVCTVNLGESAGKAAEGFPDAELALYALVNAICDNCEVEQVQVMIAGDTAEKFLGTVDISSPFEKKENLVDTSGKDKTPGVGVDPALQDDGK